MTDKPWWKRAAKRILEAGIPIPGPVRPLIRGSYRVGVWCAETWPLLLKLLWIEPVMRSVCARVGRGLRAERLPYMRGKGQLVLGDHVHLSGRSCFYFMSGVCEMPEIRLGNHVFVGNLCTFSAALKIVVGDHVLISTGVRIHDNDGHPLDAAKRRAGERIGPDDARPVIIEDGTWIGANAVILKGVTIGRNAIVGTNAVVTRDVPPDAVAAGNPARIVGSDLDGAPRGGMRA